jgi:hypothetical protein
MDQLLVNLPIIQMHGLSQLTRGLDTPSVSTSNTKLHNRKPSVPPTSSAHPHIIFGDEDLSEVVDNHHERYSEKVAAKSTNATTQPHVNTSSMRYLGTTALKAPSAQRAPCSSIEMLKTVMQHHVAQTDLLEQLLALITQSLAKDELIEELNRKLRQAEDTGLEAKKSMKSLTNSVIKYENTIEKSRKIIENLETELYEVREQKVQDNAGQIEKVLRPQPCLPHDQQLLASIEQSSKYTKSPDMEEPVATMVNVPTQDRCKDYVAG